MSRSKLQTPRFHDDRKMRFITDTNTAFLRPLLIQLAKRCLYIDRRTRISRAEGAGTLEARASLSFPRTSPLVGIHATAAKKSESLRTLTGLRVALARGIGERSSGDVVGFKASVGWATADGEASWSVRAGSWLEGEMEMPMDPAESDEDLPPGPYPKPSSPVFHTALVFEPVASHQADLSDEDAPSPPTPERIMAQSDPTATDDKFKKVRAGDGGVGDPKNVCDLDQRGGQLLGCRSQEMATRKMK
ncbi:hypothetical protein BDK51DRAFT_47596 [Blyttiomyces helicus]|uniref:Uncharacterized protein n=1 Tax=Blyttiomyces helicus TaxID=388810 RepID=A0A4V1IQ97_9FUNG|nr:hypothetical protein BDK51DRAFT_47596 [Blyttiomyces helicus]|eukprot:RKO85797.1 hypothetical protein BDK51DRAFT_47596 [Blyttiomyces helicus]